jgi:gamma-glutamylcyclotransferase
MSSHIIIDGRVYSLLFALLLLVLLLNPETETNKEEMAAVIKPKTFMYFAYGSNLLKERIIINNPSAQFKGIGKLQGYKFTYDASTSAVGYLTSYWCGPFATIRPASQKEYVWGVIWELDLNDLEALDNQETYYHPLDVDIENEKAEIVTCRTYEMDGATFNDPKPSPYYKRVVLAGARQNGLPEEYIKFLESLPDNGIAQTPPLYQKVIETVAKIRGQPENGRSSNHSLEQMLGLSLNELHSHHSGSDNRVK